MSFLGKITAAFGIYDHYQNNFYEQQTLPTVLDGQISVMEGQFLSELVRGLTGSGPIIEVGTLFGRSTLILVIAKTNERPLITIDRFSWNPAGLTPRQHEELTRKVLANACANCNVTLIRSDKEVFYQSYSGPVPSMVFLDADHSYEATKRDIEWAKQVGTEMITGHDYNPSMPGVVQAVDEMGGAKRLVDSVWLLRQS